MIYLVLSILCSTLIVLIFKAFSRYRIDAFQAIVFNYFTCFCIGLTGTGREQLELSLHWNGLPLAILLGSLFIGLFYLIARTTQLIGVTVASVAQKLSFVVPVIAGILVFSEACTAAKITGFIMAIFAVLFISMNRDPGISFRQHWWMPFIVFLGSGVCDLIIKIVETNFLGLIRKSTFTVILFGTAFIIGFTWLLIKSIRTRHRIEGKNLLAGVVLGVPNFFSIYFLLATLQYSGLEASQVFPVNNVGVILLSALAAWFIFREILSRLQLIGLLLAFLSILILL